MCVVCIYIYMYIYIYIYIYIYNMCVWCVHEQRHELVVLMSVGEQMEWIGGGQEEREANGKAKEGRKGTKKE